MAVSDQGIHIQEEKLDAWSPMEWSQKLIPVIGPLQQFRCLIIILSFGKKMYQMKVIISFIIQFHRKEVACM